MHRSTNVVIAEKEQLRRGHQTINPYFELDGSHAYSYVVSDSERAIELVAPGGLVLWHDYAGPRHAPGVYRALNELSARLPLVRLEGTTLVAYRRPSDR
ncbi:MAG: hypothetical protein ABI601_08260 [bacterium]